MWQEEPGLLVPVLSLQHRLATAIMLVRGGQSAERMVRSHWCTSRMAHRTSCAVVTGEWPAHGGHACGYPVHEGPVSHPCHAHESVDSPCGTTVLPIRLQSGLRTPERHQQQAAHGCIWSSTVDELTVARDSAKRKAKTKASAKPRTPECNIPQASVEDSGRAERRVFRKTLTWPNAAEKCVAECMYDKRCGDGESIEKCGD